MFGDLRRWLAERPLRQRAVGYVDLLLREPEDEDSRWLAGLAGGDVDHARWELRYARRALGLHVAGRDALDDRTASAVAEALTYALRRDHNVAADKLGVVERQLNARLRGYGDALSQRGAGDPTAVRLARVLLAFSGARDPGDPAAIARAGEVLAGYVTSANEALRDQFGAASLPDDVAPSRVAQG
jgi:hypothetical protein